MKLTNLFASFALALGLMAAPPPAPPPELPVEVFFRKPAYANISFSPDGKALALLQAIEGRMNLVVLDLEKMTKLLLTKFPDRDVAAYAWVGSNRLAFTLDDDGNEFFGLYVVGKDGKGYKELAGTGESQLRKGKVNPRPLVLFSKLKGDEDHYLVLSNERFAEFPDVYRVSLKTGRKVMAVENPGDVTGWMADRDGVVRIGLARKPGRAAIIYRDRDGQPWERLAEFGTEDPSWMPLGFEGDGRMLYVLSDLGRDTQAILRYDTVERKFSEPLLADDTYDADGIVFSQALNKVTGLTIEGEKPRTVWQDERFAQYQRIVDQALPGMVNSVREATPDAKQLLIHSRSDREPGVYYLMDLEKKRIREAAITREWVDPEQMAPMRPISYRARDGLLIHGYLTLPAGREPRNLPLVINPHGGPYGIRDRWGFNPEVQFLANRGFAVLQVNFRGSGGYGAAHEKAGYKKWGLEMQDDLTDGVQWAIAEGYADPKRVVIQGASYGGYAVMAGLAFTPDLYAAGVNVAGAASMKMFLEDRKNSSDISLHLLRARWGDLRADQARLEATAAELHGERVRAPVFMAYGKNDPRVKIEHGWALERALKRAGKKFEMFVKDDEGHGFRKEENAIELYQRIDVFLRQTVPR